MRTTSWVGLGLALSAPLGSIHGAALNVIGSEGAVSWNWSDDFEGLSFYGSTGNPGVTYVSEPLSVLGGLGSLALSSPSGGLAVYGNAPVGAGAVLGSGVPVSNSDFPAFGVNGDFANTAHSSSKALGANSAGSVVTIDFSQTVDAFGFYGTADMSSLFSVSFFDSGGTLIDVAQDMMTSSSDLDFWGWDSPVGIAKVKISGDYLALDHLLVKGSNLPSPPPQDPPPAVPEVAVVAPAMVALLFGAELVRRRRR